MEELKEVQNLVGDITEDDLKYVSYYSSKNLCVCIPEVGFCKYAIRPNHTHPSYSFVIFYSEEDDFFYGDKINLKKNHYIGGVISPDIHHEEPVRDEFTRYIAIFIDKDFFEKEYSAYNENYIEIFNKKLIQIDKKVMMYIEEFIMESKSHIPNKENVLKAISVVITNNIIREIAEIKRYDNHLSNKFEINKAVEYMHKNYNKKLSDKDLADISKMGESYFIHTFKSEIGMTPMEYLSKLRIDKVKKLLEINENNITEIALLCGYSSASYLSFCFNKETGMSPSRYKKNYRLM